MKWALFFLFCSCSAMGYLNGVPNLGRVDTLPGSQRNLWRGGQPLDAGWQWLWDHGVRTVVKLDYEAEGSDAGARRRGMSVVYLPMHPAEENSVFKDAAEGLKGPTQEELRAAVKAILDGLQRGGVFVHCLHGADRTGLTVAVLRVLVDRWPKSYARHEMLTYGFHAVLIGADDAWEDFAP
jgi:protein tyrosine/serine phosphatase